MGHAIWVGWDHLEPVGRLFRYSVSGPLLAVGYDVETGQDPKCWVDTEAAVEVVLNALPVFGLGGYQPVLGWPSAPERSSFQRLLSAPCQRLGATGGPEG